MRISVRQSKRNDDSVLPLINIVFLMLIFFLLASTIAPKADLDLTPPVSEDGERTAPPGKAVYLSADGLLSVFGREATFDELPSRLAPALEALGDEPLRIVADRDADGLALLDVVDAVRTAGATEIRLITLRRGNP